MYCKKCGHEIKEEWNYCPKCHCNLTIKENIENDKNIVIKKQKKEKRNSIICFCIFVISIIGFFAIEKINWIFFISSTIAIVTGILTCPNSKLIKCTFLIYCIGLGLSIFAAFIQMIFNIENNINSFMNFISCKYC